MRPISRPLRLLALLLLPALFVVPSASSQAGRCEARAGYDLFVTDPSGTTLGLQPVLPLFHYSGVPLGQYNFEEVGPHPTGTTDTIVRRLTTATPTQPVVPVELVALQLRSVEQPQHYVTVQSARTPNEAPGLPSTGTLQILFNADCSGGTLNSQFTVNFDVRVGGPKGQIILSGSETIVANGVPWTHVLQQAQELTEEGRIAAHMVRDELLNQINGVNRNLNGFDQSSDFHPGR